MIAALEGDELGAAADAPVEPVLHRHLHGDLDRHRAGVREEHPIEIAGHQGREPSRQRQRRLVRQPAEHHMRHRCELPFDRLPDVGMVVAMTGRPPRGDAVDQRAAVGERDAAAVGAHDRQRRPRGLHLRIGQPDVLQAGLVPAGPCGIARHSTLPIHRGRRHFALCSSSGHPECVHWKNLQQEARRPRSREPASRAGRDRPARRHLGRARRPAPAVVLLQRLSGAQPSRRPEGRRGRSDATPRCRQRRFPPRDRQPSPVRRARTAPRPAQGHRGSLRVRLRLSRQQRHHSGVDRPRRSGPDR